MALCVNVCAEQNGRCESARKLLILMVGAVRFERTTLRSQSECSTRLSHAPTLRLGSLMTLQAYLWPILARAFAVGQAAPGRRCMSLIGNTERGNLSVNRSYVSWSRTVCGCQACGRKRSGSGRYCRTRATGRVGRTLTALRPQPG